MKKTKILLSLIILTLTSCVELDLSPLDEPSTGSWFTTQKQFEMSLNDRYRLDFWQGAMVDWTDDYNYRNINASIIDGTLTSQDANVASLWLLQYKAIARSNTIINSIGSGRENGISESL